MADHFYQGNKYLLAKNLSETPQLLGPKPVSECLQTTLRRLESENFFFFGGRGGGAAPRSPLEFVVYTHRTHAHLKLRILRQNPVRALLF